MEGARTIEYKCEVYGKGKRIEQLRNMEILRKMGRL